MKEIIIITGAGKGIGRAIAIDFARRAKEKEQCNPILILSSRTRSDLEKVAEICRDLGTETVITETDIADTKATRNLIEMVMERFGHIDCLINNAGVGRFKSLFEMTEEDFDDTMNINAKGTFFLTQKVFPIMEQQRSGHIFFISSIAAETAFKSSSVYSMSKFAQNGLIASLRLYARECNVRVTNIMPGAVYTPMWGESGEHFKNVMMMPEDIASATVDAYLQPGRTCVEEIVIRPTGGDINS
ncbi:MAG: SDR family oxidoreductase [Prosthecochloris sp.]|uniref:Short-chain dehydrogenase/reductase SDR n=1 Tax=Prosthecochloris aestuarii (strain DSM 271 / SK 413) TaxID=290512 RepID=B4S6M5_PROA2|nr:MULTISPECIES: SDR family oxidoreductase [Prosthecochloris]ACF45780.1 short-chain dehydrogenase/reductase SDR [Prosthecochloris aestuarii DSM 271]MCW8799194.1 SDR family oxidoreductase [Prosthecochloris sp.]NEX12158.1 SDR family NAD(P)-dependent oxidoreductase [Prosthecochloris sp.]